MNNLIAKFQQARAFHQQGQLSQARAAYEKILKLQPRHLESLNSLAMIAAQAQDFKRAVQLLDMALKIEPRNPATHCNHGLALQNLDQLDLALLSYDQAIALKPGYAIAYYNRGNALRDLGRAQAAIADYELAVAANPNLAQAHYNRGVILQELEEWDRALETYDRAIALVPDYGDAHYNRGVVFQRLEQWDAALASYDRALAIHPGHAEAYCNRGTALMSLRRFSAAVANFDQAVAIKADLPKAYFHRGNALIELKQYPAAVESYDRAIVLGSQGSGVYGSRRHAKMTLCDWHNFEAERSELTERIRRNEPASPPFHVLLMSDSAQLQCLAAQSWVSEECPPNSMMPVLAKYSRRDKIRVGYFSADFHNHATLFLMAELFERHDRSSFEITAFSFGPETRDAMRNRLRSACDEFIDIRDLNDAEVASLARSLQIDIAVDLKGFTQFNRSGIFARRAAPVQISYLGYPGTMGAEYMDYLIADRTLIPADKQQHYREKIVYLPDSYQVNDASRRIADRVFSREELGLPTAGFVFSCFNNSFKLTPDVFDVWMRILERVEGSVLWLYEDNPLAVANLRREAARRKADPERLIFARLIPLAEHLARHRAADLFLDTNPYNAHTTASDALWAGLPVLTCVGEAFAGRVAASLLTAMDMPELITSTWEQYEELAVELAIHPERLAQLKLRLVDRRATASLFDARRFAVHLEAAYAAIYERHQADLPTEHIHVEADPKARSVHR